LKLVARPVDWFALTSDSPNSYTGNYLAKMGELFSNTPTVLITWERNRQGLQRSLGEAAPTPKHTIFLEDMRDAVMAAKVLERNLQGAGIRLVNWINVPDTLTDTFIYCSERLGISFPFLVPYTRCRVKPLTRAILKSAGHSKIAHEVLSCRAIARRALSGSKVCKPITGSGSQDVRIITTSEQLMEYAKKFRAPAPSRYSIAGYVPAEEFLMEDRLEGLEIQADGYVHDGEVSICALGYKQHEYGEAGFREVAGVSYFPFSLEGRCERDTDIVRWVTQVMADLKFSGGVFHLEAMDLGDCIELIEINPRPGGGGVQPICKQISGVVLATECMRLWLGLPPELKPQRGDIRCISYCILYPEHPGSLETIEPKQQFEVAHPDERLTGIWEPLWETRTEGGRPFKGDREEYLGEAHFVNRAFAPESLASTARLVREALRRRRFWTIDPPT
jgi:hypothetical protein